MLSRLALRTVALAVIWNIFVAITAIAETIAVIGTGRMGAAIGPRFTETGHSVIYGSRTPNSKRVIDLVALTGPRASASSSTDAIARADIIALALPFSATRDLLTNNIKNLENKIIFDITNAHLKALSPRQANAVESSAGQLIQEWAPNAHVVKAFNTVGYHIVANPSHAGGPVTVPLVGNNKLAKMRVAEIVQAMGFETTDSGKIANAHVTEGMAHLYFIPFGRGHFDEAFEYYFRKGTAPTGISAAAVRGAD